MEGKRAEIARAEAAALGGDGKLHFLKRRNTAHIVVYGMPRTLIWKRVDFIQLFCGKRHGGNVLY